jgi:hypothetical protein
VVLARSPFLQGGAGESADVDPGAALDGGTDVRSRGT